MLKKDMLMKALTDVDDEYIFETWAAMNSDSVKHGKNYKKMGRVMLIAAVVAALMAVTAYAAGWFSIKDRMVPSDVKIDYCEAPGVEDKGPQSVKEMSPSGLWDSPAALALRDWNDFRWKYVNNKDFVNGCDVSWVENEQQDNYRMIYGASNRTMMDKLLEISQDYGVRLHEKIAAVPNMAYLYKAAGVEPFLKTEPESFVPKYIFEDGSFSCEGVINGIGVSLTRNTADTLANGSYSMPADTEFEEWQYKTVEDTVSIALEKNKNSQGGYDAFVFFEKNGYTVCASGRFSEFDKGAAEKMADSFDYSKLCEGEPNLSLVLDTKPKNAKPKEKLLTLKDFMETPEYKAAEEFNLAYCEYADKLPEHEAFARGLKDYKYYGEFPGKDAEIDKMREQAVSNYDLISPEKNKAVWGTLYIPSDMTDVITSPISTKYLGEGITPYDIFEEADEEMYKQWLNMEKLPFEGDPRALVMYDNGAYMLSGIRDIYYIPKGDFFPLMPLFLTDEEKSWAYDTACGEQVFISVGGKAPYPLRSYSVILYETDNAYVLVSAGGESYEIEMAADSIDFTKFK